MGDDEALEAATLFYEKGINLTNKPFFKTMGDLNKIAAVFKVAADGYRSFSMPSTSNDDFVIHLVGFRHIHTQELYGFLLYSMGYPWWSSTCLGVSELAVMSMKSGAGVGRKAAEFLKKIVNYKIAHVAETGVAISDSSDIRNSYKKVGFIESPSFIYTKL